MLQSARVRRSTRVLCVSVTLWFHSSAHVSSSVSRRLGVVPVSVNSAAHPAPRVPALSRFITDETRCCNRPLIRRSTRVSLCLCDSVVPLEAPSVLGASAPRCRSCVGEQRRASSHASRRRRSSSPMRPDAAIGPCSSIDASFSVSLRLCGSTRAHTFRPRRLGVVFVCERPRAYRRSSPGPSEVRASTFDPNSSVDAVLVP